MKNRFMESPSKMTHEERQHWEEFRAASVLSPFLQIPISQFTFQDHPDLKVNVNGKNIGIEITTIHPPLKLCTIQNTYTKSNNICVLEQIVKEITFECMKSYDIFDLTFAYQFNHNIVISNIKENKEEIRKEITSMFEMIYKDIKKIEGDKFSYSFNYKGRLYFINTKIEYFPNAGWKKLYLVNEHLINISFPYEGFLLPLNFESVKELVEKKQKKLQWYKEINKDIDDYWLCLFLPFEEKGLTINGLKMPQENHYDYTKIIIAQEFPPHAHFLKK